MRLDHFVVHVDNNMDKMQNQKSLMEPKGFPYEPTWGKGTKGFKVSNLWIGHQYLEMPYLLNEDGGGWKKEWVEKYNQGIRGIYAICIDVDNVERVYEILKSRGVEVTDPERISIKYCFGLLKKNMPWRYVFSKEIPGTNLQIFFQQYDSPKVVEKFKPYMVPNTEENGIRGIEQATVKYNFSNKAIEYINKLFPNAKSEGNRTVIDMDDCKLVFEKEKNIDLKVQLNAVCENNAYRNNKIEIENLEIITG